MSRQDMRVATLVVLLSTTCALSALTAQANRRPAELLGTWRGTSTCADRVAAPACNDEVIVYDFVIGEKPGVVRWKADKVVDGKREPMGEMDLTYDAAEKCWKAEFTSPRGTTVWRVVVDGKHLTGTGTLMPGMQTIRKLDAKKD